MERASSACTLWPPGVRRRSLLIESAAALAWTEAVTLIHQGQAPDPIFAEVRELFSEGELVDLTMAIVTINGWNRLAIAFRSVPGTYKSAPRMNGPGEEQ